MKVLHIITDLQTAGAQTVVMNYLRSFHNDKDVILTVLVLGCPLGTDYEKECLSKGYNVVFLNYKEKENPSLIKPILNLLRLQFLLLGFLVKNKYDIIHTHVTPIIPYTLFPIWLRRPKKYFHTLHSDPEAISPSVQKWARFAFLKCGVIPICVTEYQKNKAEKAYHLSNPIVIHNGIDFNPYLLDVNREDVRAQIGIEESQFVIGYVGRLNTIKNIPFLLKVFQAYKQRHENALLLIIGEGEERNYIKQIINDLNISKSVKLLGQRSDVATLYKIMDLFMLCSYHESSSIVTVEAQIAGVRCVVSDNIPDNVVISSRIQRVSLNVPISRWVDAMEDTSDSGSPIVDINEYNIVNTVSQLKSIYLHG